jgi:hypothetical protein
MQPLGSPRMHESRIGQRQLLTAALGPMELASARVPASTLEIRRTCTSWKSTLRMRRLGCCCCLSTDGPLLVFGGWVSLRLLGPFGALHTSPDL